MRIKKVHKVNLEEVPKEPEEVPEVLEAYCPYLYQALHSDLPLSRRYPDLGPVYLVELCLTYLWIYLVSPSDLYHHQDLYTYTAL